MSLENIKAFIFDLDGTLIDTEKIYRQVWPQAMKSLGYEYTDVQYLSMRSLGRPYAPAKFKEWYGQDFDYDGARRVRKGLFDAYVAEHGIEIKKGAIELLEYLRSKKIVTAIATATDLDRAEEYLKFVGLYGYFDKVISATMVDEGKPSPKVYQYASMELGFEPSECVAVEDAPNGIKSAYSAGLKVIMVPDQTEPEEDIMHMFYAKVESLDQIIGLVE
ncbi:MAG: HAD family phosphatase [Lachnospiraceae bacterium]|nr:HAD family phosphatase [Lachnospiraceae bacterium]